VLDHIERVRQGLPVYGPPTADWIPFLYPPLYYWIAAPLGGSYLACRLLGIGALGVQLGCVYWLIRRGGAPRFWRTVRVLLPVACFSSTGWWYDIERRDPLLGALMLLACVVLSASRRPSLTLAGGALLGLGFFAKQPALLFVAGAAVALWLRRERWRALLVV